MPEFQTISKQHPAFPEYLNFEKLRAIGIDHLQQMSGQVWTDYNLHDPGVTILEVLCYAITDLGYRNNLDIKDLLTRPTSPEPQADNNFFTPDQILTCNPVTAIDVRKRLLDIEGVRNAWIEPYRGYRMEQQSDGQGWTAKLVPPPPPTVTEAPAPDLPSHFEVKGLYTVRLDLDAAPQRDACGQFYDDDSSILDQVYAVLSSYRNLCEDIHEVIVLGEEAIGLRANLDLEATANAEDILVEAFIRVQNFLAPHLKFYTLQEMLARGKDPTEIFAGRPSALGRHDLSSPRDPLDAQRAAPSHGFIDTQELETLKLPTQLHTSDLYAVLLTIPGVLTVSNLTIRRYINDVARSQEEPWRLDLTPNYRPVLGIDQSQLSLHQGGVQVSVDRDRAQRRYAQQKLKHLKAHRSDTELDLSVPQGIHYKDLAEHYSIHHDFPLTYGISEDGLPATATAERKAQAKQLQGYLVFFDQILANYLMQLSQVRELFSWGDAPASAEANGEVDRLDPSLIKTYFPQVLDFPGAKEILTDSARTLEKSDIGSNGSLITIGEDRETALERRSRFLDHMLARFAESFTDYVLINYRQSHGEGSIDRQDTTGQLEASIIADKAQFLRDYPMLGRDRFRAINYRLCDHQSVQNSHQASGFEERVGHLLGMHDIRRRSLIHYEVVDQPSDFTVRVGWGNGDSDEDRPLICRHTFPTLVAAQQGLDTLLEAMLTPDRYQPLVYRNPYHGLEVVDTDGSSLVIYDQAYPTEASRNAAIGPLVERLKMAVPEYFTQYFEWYFVNQLQPFVSLISPELFSKIRRPKPDALIELQPFEEDVAQDQISVPFDLPEETLQAVLPELRQKLGAVLEILSRDIPEAGNLAGQLLSAMTNLLDNDNLAEEIQITLQDQEESFTQNRLQKPGGPYREFGFAFNIAPKARPSFRFVSAQRYNTAAEARVAALRALVQVQDEKYYHPISLRSEDVDPGVAVDGKLTTYGFAIADADNHILAGMDNTLGRKTAAERDAVMLALHSSQSTMQINKVKKGFKYSFIVDAGNEPLTRTNLTNTDTELLKQIAITSKATFSSRETAWAAVQKLNEALHRFRCYRTKSVGNSYQLIITDPDENNDLARSEFMSPASDRANEESLRLHAFRWINSLSPFVRYTQEPLPDRDPDSGYRFQIFDRRDEICLEGCQWFETYEIAQDHCYRDVIGVLWEAEAITRTSTNGRHSFTVVRRNGDGTHSELAIHPQNHTTAAGRDEAIRRLQTLVRTAHLNIKIEQMVPGCRGEVNLDRQTQLQTTRHFPYDLARLEISYCLPEPDDSADVDRSTFSGHTFAPFAEWWDASHWNEVITALQGRSPLTLSISPRQDNASGVSGYRFYLTPILTDEANLLWQFVSRRAYRLPYEAETEGQRAIQLLQELTVPTVDRGYLYWTGRETANPPPPESTAAIPSPVPPTAPTPGPPFPTPTVWLLQQERLHTVNYSLVLIDAETQQRAKDRAINYGDALVRMAEIDDTYRRVDPQLSDLGETGSSIAAYSWALLGPDNHRAIAIHPQCYGTAAQRDASIETVQHYIDDEGLHVVEHILLRSPPVFDDSPEPQAETALPATFPIMFSSDQGLGTPETGSTHGPLDPYSFWLTVVLPVWPKRFQKSAFRQFVERTLRQEAPAHIALRVAWLDLPQMHRFEVAYERWFEQLAVAACHGSACGQAKATQTLIEVLTDLRSVYPVSHLSGLATAGFAQNPVILNQTPLGTNYE